MNYPKISIVTPVFNQVNFIEQTIQSVIGQQYPSLEYIIVDGGSTDGTLEIIEKYRHRITRVISEPDNGMYDALNKGFQLSTGELMAWINADDLYHYNSFFIVAELFSKYADVEFLMGQPTTFDEQNRCVFVSELRQWGKFDFLISRTNWPIQQESTFWRRSIWERAGGYISTEYKLAGDCELWTRFFMKANGRLNLVSALLGGFRSHHNQLSSNRSGYSQEVKTIYERVQKSPDDLKAVRKILFYQQYLLRIPVLRVLFRWHDKYQQIFNYPKIIRYHLLKKQF